MDLWKVTEIIFLQLFLQWWGRFMWNFSSESYYATIIIG